MKQKEEAGEVRYEVDFEQLKIENRQCNDKFEYKNQELLKLKLSAGNTLQVLGLYKVILLYSIQNMFAKLIKFVCEGNCSFNKL